MRDRLDWKGGFLSSLPILELRLYKEAVLAASSNTLQSLGSLLPGRASERLHGQGSSVAES